MKRLITMGLAVALCGTGLAASALDATTKEVTPSTQSAGMRHMGMKSMDGNGDGVISKAEFTTRHERMWEHMEVMDDNGDGAISKAEFMKHHDAMWDGMKKDGNGNVTVKEMESMHDATMMDRMHGGKMMSH